MDGRLILRRLGGRRHILLLQGPCGWFFSRLATFLSRAGCQVDKVNLNAGDRFFFRGPGTYDFSGEPCEWRHWLEQFIEQRRIDCIMLFGDCRAHHVSAIKLARERGIQVLVFEEGYLRPGFVTLEPDGVNANSQIPAMFEAQRPAEPGRLDPRSIKVSMPPARPGQRLFDYAAMGLQACLYALAMRLGRAAYPHYVHHKPFRIRREIFCGLLSLWRKLVYRLEDWPSRYRLSHRLAGQYFVVPLQVYNDSQLTHHSNFADQAEFIGKVIESFARHSDPAHQLVFKHHPMDRGHRYYGQLLDQLAQRFKLDKRIHYIHDIRLPGLFKSARGVITVNSTAGLSALYHGTPVICLGRSLYDRPGLTHQDGIDSFWHSAHGPIGSEVVRLRGLLREHALLTGSFYHGAPKIPAGQASRSSRGIAAAAQASADPCADLGVRGDQS